MNERFVYSPSKVFLGLPLCRFVKYRNRFRKHFIEHVGLKLLKVSMNLLWVPFFPIEAIEPFDFLLTLKVKKRREAYELRRGYERREGPFVM